MSCGQGCAVRCPPMRRLARRLFTLCSAVSLLLAVLFAGLSASSTARPRRVSATVRDDRYSIGLVGGRWTLYGPPPTPPWRAGHGESPAALVCAAPQRPYRLDCLPREPGGGGGRALLHLGTASRSDETARLASLLVDGRIRSLEATGKPSLASPAALAEVRAEAELLARLGRPPAVRRRPHPARLAVRRVRRRTQRPDGSFQLLAGDLAVELHAVERVGRDRMPSLDADEMVASSRRVSTPRRCRT